MTRVAAARRQLRNVAAVHGTGHLDFDSETHTTAQAVNLLNKFEGKWVKCWLSHKTLVIAIFVFLLFYSVSQ